jgi:hypothetical protein
VDDVPQESQPFRHNSPIPPDSLYRGGGVSSEEGPDSLGPGKQARRVIQLRCLDSDHPREVKDIFIAEKLESSRPPAELMVV